MFARVKKSGAYQYLQLVENRRENGKVAQRVIATLGRMDQLNEKGSVESIIRSLSRFSDSACRGPRYFFTSFSLGSQPE